MVATDAGLLKKIICDGNYFMVRGTEVDLSHSSESVRTSLKLPDIANAD